MSLVHQAQILNGDAGLLQGSRSSVVRASTAKVGGLGFDSQWLPKVFPSVRFYSDLPPVAYQQFLLPVVVIRIVTKIIMYLSVLTCYMYYYTKQFSTVDKLLLIFFGLKSSLFYH